MYTRSIKGETFPAQNTSKSWIFDVGLGTKYSVEFKYTINAASLSSANVVTLRISVSNVANTTSYSSLSTATIVSATTSEKSIIIAQPDGSVGKYMKISAECGAIGAHGNANTLEIYLTTY